MAKMLVLPSVRPLLMLAVLLLVDIKHQRRLFQSWEFGGG
jgi:hypothetical protein